MAESALTFNNTQGWTPPMMNFSQMNVGNMGFGSFGNNGWTAPLLNFNNFGNTWGNFYFGGASNTGSSTSSSSRTNMTAEELEEQKRKDAKKWDELNAKRKEIVAQEKAVKAEQTKLRNSKNADGTATKIKDLGEMTTWQKVKRGAWNAFVGLGNLCKSLVGYDKDGKWQPMKLVRNIAIAAGMTVACIYAPPLAATIAAKLGASAATVAAASAVTKTALVTVPAIAAFGGGVIKTGKGVYDACNAKTTEDFDRATESVGQGLAVAFAARTGLKQISKSAGVSATAAEGASLWTRCKVDLANTFVNPFKAAGVEAQAAVANMTSTANSAGLSSLKNLSFTKCMSSARNGVKNLHADVKIQGFEKELSKVKNQLNEAMSPIENRLNEINRNLNSNLDDITRAQYEASIAREKALLEFQLNKMKRYSSALDGRMTSKRLKTLLKAIKKDATETKPYKWYNFGSSKFKINGQDFTKAELKEYMTTTRNLGESVKNITKQKYNTMSSISGTSKYADAVNDFGMSNKWYAKPYNWAYAKWNQGIEKGQLFGLGMSCMAPVYALDPLLRNPVMSVNNLAILADPSYEKPQGDLIAADQVKAEEQQIKDALTQISKQKDTIKKQMEQLA